jgi:D-glycero-D-manno-heptose 1,7-bisphosphate phosphatase
VSERQGTGRPVILDRDGTIVIDRHYLSDADGLAFLPGAAEGLRLMYSQGCRLIVITNQSGVGRGMFTLDALDRMNIRLAQMVEQAGARLEKIYYCPHRPEDQCLCRKPGTHLMSEATLELGFVSGEAVVIGDKTSDIEFGRRCGAATMLIVEDPADPRARSTGADHLVRNLLEAAMILQQESEH